MNNQEIEKVIREYIEQVVHMSLATARDNTPWACEVHFAYDSDLNLYFISNEDTRHSLDIADNPSVAGSIVTQHHKHQKVRGVYFEGVAEQIQGIDNSHPGYVAYVSRLGGWPGMLEQISDNANAAMYKISVKNYYMFDGYDGGRNKYQLPWGKKS